MNNWGTILPTLIFESDDTCDRYDRNGMNFLFWWKSLYPNFKISLFTIPDRTSRGMIELLKRHEEWIELCVHGFNHESNYENYSWDYDRTMRLMERIEGMGPYKKIYKSPGWCITPDYNGYPADENAPISKDKQAVYKALTDRGYWIVDRHYNVPARPKNVNVICIDDQPLFVHSHSWNMETGDKNSRNGYQQIQEEHGIPWDHDSQFYFISEAIEKGMVKSCQNLQ